MKITSKIVVILSFCIYLGCSEVEITHSDEPRQSPTVSGIIATANSAEENKKATKDLANQNSDLDEREIKPHTLEAVAICESYILRKLAKRNLELNQTVRLKDFNPKDENLQIGLKDWLKNRSKKNAVAFRFRHDENSEGLIVVSNSLGATGIAINFQNWFVQIDNNEIKFLSLSENPKLIFLDRDGLLNYYSIEFSSEFLENKNWDNLTLDLLWYRVKMGGDSELISEERNVKCK